MNDFRPTTKLRAIGIDVGFHSTKFTTGRVSEGVTRDAIPTDQFPSVAPEVVARSGGPSGTAPTDGVRILVDGVTHFVGKDTLLEAGGSWMTAVTPSYSESTSYKALFKGALYAIAKANDARGDVEIDMVVGGLPMASYADHKAKLEVFMAGEHEVPSPMAPDKTIKVRVKRAKVLGQPQGALINHQLSKGVAFAKDQLTLVLDLGGGTFDWYVAKEAKGSRYRSGSVPTGALACAKAVCKQIRQGLQDNPDVVYRVDEALRTGAESVSISGQKFELTDYSQAVSNLLTRALDKMSDTAGDLSGMDTILFTGGGAKLVHKVALNYLSDYNRVFAIDGDTMVSNVRGFHFWAEHLIASEAHTV